MQNSRQVQQSPFRTKVLKGYLPDSVIHHSDNITALKNHGYDKSIFITNFIYKVYNKHPSGRSLVYSYRLLYRPTTRADHPYGLAALSTVVGATRHLRCWGHRALDISGWGYRCLAGRDRRC